MKNVKIGLSLLAMSFITSLGACEHTGSKVEGCKHNQKSTTCSKETCTVKEGHENWDKDYIVTTRDTKGQEFYLNITNIKKEAHIGLGYAKISGDTNPNLSAGVGISATIDNNIYVGTNADLEYQNTQGSSLLGATLELKGGYVFNKDVSAYGIVGVKSVDYPHSVDGTGLGLGIGAEYTLCPKHSVSAELSTYDVKLDSGMQDYDHNSLRLKYKFNF